MDYLWCTYLDDKPAAWSSMAGFINGALPRRCVQFACSDTLLLIWMWRLVVGPRHFLNRHRSKYCSSRSLSPPRPSLAPVHHSLWFNYALPLLFFFSCFVPLPAFVMYITIHHVSVAPTAICNKNLWFTRGRVGCIVWIAVFCGGFPENYNDQKKKLYEYLQVQKVFFLSLGVVFTRRMISRNVFFPPSLFFCEKYFLCPQEEGGEKKSLPSLLCTLTVGLWFWQLYLL